jgi:hypothetical protein
MKTLGFMQDTQKCFSWRKTMVLSIELDLDTSINLD